MAGLAPVLATCDRVVVRRIENSEELAEELRQASLDTEEVRLDALICEALPDVGFDNLFMLSTDDRDEFLADLNLVASYRDTFAPPYADMTWFATPDHLDGIRQETARVEQAISRLKQFKGLERAPQPNVQEKRNARPLLG